ncbi:MAG: protease modulator HflC [Burkholderiaceae bacterium]
MNRAVALIAVILLLVLIASSMIFIVDQRNFAIVFTFQKVKEVIAQPGLYLKWPYPVDQVVTVDKRIQTIDGAQADKYITSEKRNLLVDLFVKWQITDPVRYYVSFHGEKSLAQDRLMQIIRAGLNEEFTKRTVAEVVSSQREEVMNAVRTKVAKDAGEVGIRVVDVRLKRVDLLATISERVYQRMQAERNRVANQLRSTGAAEEEQIKADADRQTEVILADAYEKSQAIQGEGDAKASQIYAEAFGRDPQFYAFYKSLEAYRRTFSGHDDLIIVDPSSEFFKYMKNPTIVPNPKK